ncbi:MAG: phage holin family protein [Duganella sp.]
MTHACTVIAFLAYALTCLRLLLYRKQGARHRRHVSWVAWVLLVILVGSAVELAVDGHPIGTFEAARAVVLSLIVFGARGNVARLLRSEEA